MTAQNASTGTTQPTVVRLYTRLYAARFGFVSHPQPRGALSGGRSA
jgi:hypothetical protein